MTTSTQVFLLPDYRKISIHRSLENFQRCLSLPARDKNIEGAMQFLSFCQRKGSGLWHVEKGKWVVTCRERSSMLAASASKKKMKKKSLDIFIHVIRQSTHVHIRSDFEKKMGPQLCKGTDQEHPSASMPSRTPGHTGVSTRPNVSVEYDLSKLAVITVVFNPVKYNSRYEHYENFARHMRSSGVDLYTVECIFPSTTRFGLPRQSFEVTQPNNSRHIQLSAPSILWMKENLINIAVTKLPAHVEYVAWIDADIEFDVTLRFFWSEENEFLFFSFLGLATWLASLDDCRTSTLSRCSNVRVVILSWSWRKERHSSSWLLIWLFHST